MDDGAIRNGVQLNVAQAGFCVCRFSLQQPEQIRWDRLSSKAA